MKILRATLVGSLAPEPVLVKLASEVTSERISRWSPKPIDPADVHVRAFLGANSRPSKDNFLRIKEKAIKKLARLYPGAPLMRNHESFTFGGMPIGTVFDAWSGTAPDKAEELYLGFYLARGDGLGDRAAKYIDLGIWKESSIHGYFSEFTCSLCEKSLDPEDDDCCSEHETGREYKGETALMELGEPTEAPEFSLCWSGRLAGTRALSRSIPGTTTVSKLMDKRAGWLAQLGKARPEEVIPSTGSWLSNLKKGAA